MSVDDFFQDGDPYVDFTCDLSELFGFQQDFLARPDDELPQASRELVQGQSSDIMLPGDVPVLSRSSGTRSTLQDLSPDLGDYPPTRAESRGQSSDSSQSAHDGTTSSNLPTPSRKSFVPSQPLLPDALLQSFAVSSNGSGGGVGSLLFDQNGTLISPSDHEPRFDSPGAQPGLSTTHISGTHSILPRFPAPQDYSLYSTRNERVAASDLSVERVSEMQSLVPTWGPVTFGHQIPSQTAEGSSSGTLARKRRRGLDDDDTPGAYDNPQLSLPNAQEPRPQRNLKGSKIGRSRATTNTTSTVSTGINFLNASEADVANFTAAEFKLWQQIYNAAMEAKLQSGLPSQETPTSEGSSSSDELGGPGDLSVTILGDKGQTSYKCTYTFPLQPQAGPCGAVVGGGASNARNFRRHLSVIHGRHEIEALEAGILKLSQVIALRHEFCEKQSYTCSDDQCLHFIEHETRWHHEEWRRIDRVTNAHTRTHRGGSPDTVEVPVKSSGIKRTGTRRDHKGKNEADNGGGMGGEGGLVTGDGDRRSTGRGKGKASTRKISDPNLPNVAPSTFTAPPTTPIPEESTPPDASAFIYDYQSFLDDSALFSCESTPDFRAQVPEGYAPWPESSVTGSEVQYSGSKGQPSGSGSQKPSGPQSITDLLPEAEASHKRKRAKRS